MLNKTTILLALMIVAFRSESLQAQEFDISFSGFSTLGLSYNNSDKLKFHRDFLMESNDGWAMNTDSTIGGQVNIVFDKSWDAVVQVVYQDRISDELNDYFEWAFLRYRLNRNWSLRAGRLHSDMYLLSEYKSVGYAYLWARPPVEFYSPTASISQLNGFDIQYSFNIGQGFLQTKIAYGAAEAQMSSSLNNFSLEFEDILIANMTFSKNNWKLMASYADIHIGDFKSPGFQTLIEGIANVPTPLWPEANEIVRGLSSIGHSINYLALGYQFEDDSWVFQTEFGSTVSGWNLLPSYYNGYFSTGYKRGKWTYYATISAIEPKYKFESIPQQVHSHFETILRC